MQNIIHISIRPIILRLCKLIFRHVKKVNKPSKDVLTFSGSSGILTKLFGDELSG